MTFEKYFAYAATFLGIAAAPALAEPIKWSCPDAGQGRVDFLDGTMAGWSNYSESDGARVQRQHPATAFVGAQAKFIEINGTSAGVCQYYNHIGLVATSLAIGSVRSPDTATCDADTSDCGDRPYWRLEFMESNPELDQPGREQMLVCMENTNGLAYPSTGCGFEATLEEAGEP